MDDLASDCEEDRYFRACLPVLGSIGIMDLSSIPCLSALLKNLHLSMKAQYAYEEVVHTILPTNIVTCYLCKGSSGEDEYTVGTFQVSSTFDFFGVWPGNSPGDTEGAYSLVPQTSSNFGPIMAVVENM